MRHLDEDKTLAWAADRVCQSGRFNISEILDHYGLDHYNEFLLTIAVKTSVVDRDTLEEVT